MIIGAHSVIYSADPSADCIFLRDALGLSSVDAGGGYLVFGLPPAEISVHESSENELQQEVYRLCENIETFLDDMSKHDVSCSPVRDQGWGLLTELTLPGGGRLGVDQPAHNRPVARSSE